MYCLRIGCDHGQVIIHDLRSNTPSRVFNLNTIINNNNNDNNSNNSSSKRGICCLSTMSSGNNNSISTGSYDYIYNSGNGNTDSSMTAVVGGDKLIAGCTNGYVTVFEPFHQMIYTNNKLHSDDIRSVQILPSSSSSSSNHQFHDNNIISSPRFNQHESYQLLTSSYDGTAMIWNMLTNQQTNEYKFYGKPKILKGHSDKVLQAIPVFHLNKSRQGSRGSSSGGGRRNSMVDVITTAADGKVLLWTVGSS